MAKRVPIPEPSLAVIRDEAVHIPTGDTRYTIDLDEVTVEALERGICPEDLSQRMHDLLKWRRDAIRATTRTEHDEKTVARGHQHADAGTATSARGK
jgi:hypothetical protein